MLSSTKKKNRLLRGGAIKHVTEEEMKYDDIETRSLREILYPELESLGIELADWPETLKETKRLRSPPPPTTTTRRRHDDDINFTFHQSLDNSFSQSP